MFSMCADPAACKYVPRISHDKRLLYLFPRYFSSVLWEYIVHTSSMVAYDYACKLIAMLAHSRVFVVAASFPVLLELAYKSC